MEARDTVNHNCICAPFKDMNGSSVHLDRCWSYNIGRLVQAEITWKARDSEIEEARKAGYDEAIKRHGQYSEDSLILGRKEVVEWIENHTHPMNTNMYGISLGRDAWQARLKEWGIK